MLLLRTDGKMVADLIHARLSIPIETDEEAVLEYLEQEEAHAEDDDRAAAAAAAEELEAQAEKEAEGSPALGEDGSIEVPELEDVGA